MGPALHNRSGTVNDRRPESKRPSGQAGGLSDAGALGARSASHLAGRDHHACLRL